MQYELDATNQTLGRLASKIAILLRGKNLPSFNPRILPQTEVTIKNLSKARFTGSKLDTKKYYRYTGHPGGIKTQTLRQRWEAKPKELMTQMVYHMLPENRSRNKIIKNLKFE
ncbi:MAG: 50S ribosomal protein L13 [Candidatus Yanofskybacteria bacterium RIFCSPHIGHO2_01_FULL_45_42]|uniref:50S ribosomal protein L13 n=3 Tax=Candidatus Yanofskyibacteriota TaxID=1752733 RepID=A0A1F8H354_9BACT|nr:MAG: 50S ribosomal protein L13 [Candidatus Yanofskybacteria bacterium RIFCSPHIGHO2_01_FULL_45_42]OGN16884.1 MAG: 50S ribosomal protein L13 [Candidatus Yanofskybacteria bacterium RIFCSPHIGHO2_02_FULL_46_19]OGN27572.1 MAG: 50S ribosomal protein L13 [Candidatus Yanofskybacteria bacterium RIFCSPLOWO2_01_FULL_45_72]OGN32037.1 MAG: 50S ribosomal protein L13 [Candidatus Yanofskybacteria bacterium RIFCSPLOWO2_02_FULL_45_18]